MKSSQENEAGASRRRIDQLTDEPAEKPRYNYGLFVTILSAVAMITMIIWAIVILTSLMKTSPPEALSLKNKKHQKKYKHDMHEFFDSYYESYEFLAIRHGSSTYDEMEELFEEKFGEDSDEVDWL
mmetsp:Transcript_25390/g.24738  ORF Transcript_25390/g.24738 Transcript_25390/m.24738 type:complete len:126 (-) Transcript_25390:726-1103(-)